MKEEEEQEKKLEHEEKQEKEEVQEEGVRWTSSSDMPGPVRGGLL